MTSEDRILYHDFETLARINKRVVSLTQEKHEYTEVDERRLRKLLADVEGKANDEERIESIIQKASLLTFGTAKGQYFYEGNKRTALVAARSFLRMNGFEMDITDKGLVNVLDQAGIGEANLSKLAEIVRRLIRSV